MSTRALAFVIAAAFVAVMLFLVPWLGTGGKEERKQLNGHRWTALFVGADGRLSTSKFQFFTWTAFGLFGFAVVLIERAYGGSYVFEDLPLPQNLLLAMGFGAATMAGAKAIKTANVREHRVASTQAGEGSKGGLLTTDDGVPDLAKVQMVAFTIIAVLMYVARLWKQSAQSPVFMDIDQSLMYLLGLSQSAYLGDKIAGSYAQKKGIAE